ncbi:hypothetical protein [Convivina praedatoris]|uniref:Uncharacterized protein n=1 Tax=Convivina praedatoris TaxID=2880963 RepID=A0ABN8HBE2_9LACO|nr:hypothetical protein [Convivina sp. LMG 32447]CAH1850180.1 hypothetical protein R078138_00084 [Convivina sp. LMG 32447]CAH1851002.1 hypothetical protein LMG032447_00248 [Convivina sp. LMG 32447]CAH1851015.1 hypothetical protein R077815_00246 [Convivina sp. LMG 32447]
MPNVLNPNDLRSISKRDQRYRRAQAILEHDWARILVEEDHGSDFITVADIDFAQKISQYSDQYVTLELNSFSKLQHFITDFQSYLPQLLIQKLKEPFL